MNRFLYGLIGICVAGATVAAFYAKVDIAKLGKTDFEITIGFIVVLIVSCLAWRVSPWSKRLNARFKRDEDEERIQAREQGTVRRPRGPLP